MSLEELTHLWTEQPLQPAALDLLPSGVEVIEGASAAPAQAVIAVSRVKYDSEFFGAAPNVRIVSRAGIGLDNVDVGLATERGIVVCNAPDGVTESTAEHAVALMMAAARKLRRAADGMAAGAFGPRKALLGTELRGKTIGLIGVGRIGSRVGEMCRLGFGMKVLGCDPALSKEEAERRGVTPATLEEVLSQSDIVSLYVPLTPETKGLINRERIALMKRGAILVNVARGGVMVEKDLIDALDSGHLAGAGVDVFDTEPPPEDAAIRRHPDVIATPHVASVTAEGRSRTDCMAVEAALALFRGEKPANVVNPEVWRKIDAVRTVH